MASESSSAKQLGLFERWAHEAARAVGSVAAFIVAGGIIIVWAAAGPWFGFSDTWQLLINTGTTIVTFLMVFLIQNTQNRDSAAIHLKLNELIRAIQGAHNRMINLETASQKELDHIKAVYEHLAVNARDQRNDSNDTGTPNTLS